VNASAVSIQNESREQSLKIKGPNLCHFNQICYCFPLWHSFWMRRQIRPGNLPLDAETSTNPDWHWQIGPPGPSRHSASGAQSTLRHWSPAKLFCMFFGNFKRDFLTFSAIAARKICFICTGIGPSRFATTSIANCGWGSEYNRPRIHRPAVSMHSAFWSHSWWPKAHSFSSEMEIEINEWIGQILLCPNLIPPFFPNLIPHVCLINPPVLH
jgi:hypothetical protein